MWFEHLGLILLRVDDNKRADEILLSMLHNNHLILTDTMIKNVIASLTERSEASGNKLITIYG